MPTEWSHPRGTDDLLPIVYDEMRRLAAQKLSNEQSGQTITASDLVHEAYIRLIGDERPTWENRRHFFGAAAEAMRRILIERARRRESAKRGGDRRRLALDEADLTLATPAEDVLALDEALDELAAEDPLKAEMVKLRFYAGLNVEQVAAALDLSDRSIRRHWEYARVWLLRRLIDGS